MWLFCYLVSRGVKDAAVINYIVTVAKVVPILMFIVIAVIAFKADVFADNFWGGDDGYSLSSIWDQATGTMLITVFVFLGIEGASVYSRMARKREDVGRATVIGFLSVLSVFALVTMVSYGVMPQAELAERKSAFDGRGAGIHRRAVGIDLHSRRRDRLGARRLPRVDADGRRGALHTRDTDDMPRFLARTNRHGAPLPALVMAAGLTSLLLVALLFASDALDFMLDLTAALSLIPYLLAAAYALKLTVTRETYGDGKSLVGDMVIAAVATVYTLFLIYAAGVDKLLLSCILYAPAAALYFKARRERGLRVFTPAEAVLFGVILLGAVAGVVSLATGAIEI